MDHSLGRRSEHDGRFDSGIRAGPRLCDRALSSCNSSRLRDGGVHLFECRVAVLWWHLRLPISQFFGCLAVLDQALACWIRHAVNKTTESFWTWAPPSSLLQESQRIVLLCRGILSISNSPKQGTTSMTYLIILQRSTFHVSGHCTGGTTERTPSWLHFFLAPSTAIDDGVPLRHHTVKLSFMLARKSKIFFFCNAHVVMFFRALSCKCLWGILAANSSRYNSTVDNIALEHTDLFLPALRWSLLLTVADLPPVLGSHLTCNCYHVSISLGCSFPCFQHNAAPFVGAVRA